MAEEEGRKDLEHPNLSHLVVLTMEDLSDKLKVLNYEKQFCRKLNFKPLSRHYFALPTNPGEQFHYFTNLAVWLLKLCAKNLEQPQESDDPNATIATILDAAKKLGVSVDFAPSKLKSGCGQYVCALLNELADCAMKVVRFTFKRPVIREESVHDEVMGDDTDELRISRMEDEILEEGGGADSDEGGDDGGTFLDFTGKAKHGKQDFPLDQVGDMLKPSVDATAWQMEVERVLPHLKVTIRSDHRDWRSHYEQMHQHKDSIEALMNENRAHLNKVSGEITKTLEKITSREKYINSQLEHQIEEFRASQNRLAEEREYYKQGSSSVNDLTRQLQQITEELETVKAQMDERGTSMTDAGPLVRIKQALTRVQAESTEMDLRIGVVEHTLMAAKIKNKSAMHLRMHAPMSDSEFVHI